MEKAVKSQIGVSSRLSVAPMMDWTDRHCRYFHRQISRETLLYTEMVTAPALVRGGAVHLLDYDPAEHPVALQLGGSDPAELAQAAVIGAERGYDEINLNVGCPSDRVQSGSFGAVLMKDPALVAQCVSAMAAACDAEITVKCRIGVDDQNPQAVLPDFLAQISDAGVRRVTVHARMAWLDGLSPKENRDIPPLDYDLVHRMKAAFAHLHLSVNGGIVDLVQAQGFLDAGLDGVMIGRAGYHSPMQVLGRADQDIYGADTAPVSPSDVIDRMVPYIEAHIAGGGRLHSVSRHMLGLFAGQPGARIWRRTLSELAPRADAGPWVLQEALERVEAQQSAA